LPIKLAKNTSSVFYWSIKWASIDSILLQISSTQHAITNTLPLPTTNQLSLFFL
ncbi:uncharacterized protein B0P05DRAFT_476312, partial [Gilbertella persicaria]|uniref:uncharacterized protein n=1 Tax=Gilbertella persicaria TaxID=101096 RepID=UPI00221EF910